MNHQSVEFLKATETGQYCQPNKDAAGLYNLLIAAGAEIDRRSFCGIIKPAHPAVLRRAGELITNAKRAMMRNEYEAQEIKDTVDIARALTRWAFADLVLYDPLEVAYHRGLMTLEEWARLAGWENMEQCTCTGADNVACGYCKAMNRIDEIKGELNG